MRRRDPARRRPALLPSLAAVTALALAAAGCGSGQPRGSSGSSSASRSMNALAANPAVDPGSPLGGAPAPAFRLLDQFGRPVSLSQFRGQAVLLSFVDSRCSNVCPLTTTSMLDALGLLGPAARDVQLIGIDANPDATRVSDVRAYSAAHGLTNRWLFLTGTLATLKQVWKGYHVYVQAIRGSIDHEPAIYLIRPDGREQSVFLTQMAYAATGQQAQVLANATAAVLPGRPPVRQAVSLRYLPGIKPADRATLPVAGGKAAGKTVTFGPGHPRLVVFFATWVAENSDLSSQMLALNAYQQAAAVHGWPPVVAVDEASTETTPGSLAAFLAGLHGRLDFPVVADRYGQLSDGYGVQDQPWIDLVSASGKILFRNDGWLAEPGLERAAGRALASSG